MEQPIIFYKHHKRIKPGSNQHKQFIKQRYITCDCGYNNKKDRIERFGTCLRCGKVLYPKIYLKNKLNITDNLIKH